MSRPTEEDLARVRQMALDKALKGDEDGAAKMVALHELLTEESGQE